MLLQCALVFSFNLLSQAAEGDKDADGDRGVSFCREERLHQCLCRYKGKETGRHVLSFWGGWVEKEWNFMIVVASSLYWWLFFLQGNGVGQGRGKLFSPSGFSIYFLHLRMEMLCLPKYLLLFLTRRLLQLNLCLWAVIAGKNKGCFWHVGIFLKEDKGKEKGRKMKGSGISPAFFLFCRLFVSLGGTASFQHHLV